MTSTALLLLLLVVLVVAAVLYYRIAYPPRPVGPRPCPPGPEAPGDYRGKGDESEDVHVTTVVPDKVRPGDAFLVEAILHVESFEVEEASGQVVESDVAVVSLAEGARLTARLVPVQEEAFRIDRSEIEIVWKAPYRRADFLVTASRDLSDGLCHLRLELWSGHVQLSRTYVEIQVDASSQAGRRRKSPLGRRLPRSAFASYSRQDSDRVQDRVAALETLGVKVFFDKTHLRQGSRWEQTLYDEIERREAFLLFWSRAAAESKWVESEWRHCLLHRGADAILPNALEPPKLCPPPRELGHLQFGSVLDKLRDDWASAD